MMSLAMLGKKTLALPQGWMKEEVQVRSKVE